MVTRVLCHKSSLLLVLMFQRIIKAQFPILTLVLLCMCIHPEDEAALSHLLCGVWVSRLLSEIHLS